MKTKRDVVRLAKRLGAELIVDDRFAELDVEVEAPYGHHWTDCDVHVLVGHQNDDDTRAMLWDDLWERMKGGVELCRGHGGERSCGAMHNGQCDFWTGSRTNDYF